MPISQRQPLREAVSWNIMSMENLGPYTSQPLREAVSWNAYSWEQMTMEMVSLFVRLWVEMRYWSWKVLLRTGQPLREAVSWNTDPHRRLLAIRCQPLREAVSWNNNVIQHCADLVVSLFVRLWVEIFLSVISVVLLTVSLFVRLWVEIIVSTCAWRDRMCQPLREAVSWNRVWSYWITGNHVVSLFVRLWVEIYPCQTVCIWVDCQPLREAVSWNASDRIYDSDLAVSLFVRLWVEIRSEIGESNRLKSASSWGCELKYLSLLHLINGYCQPLREAVSWNTERSTRFHANISQPLREAVSWNTICKRRCLMQVVSLFVRLWVEMHCVVPVCGIVIRQPLREAVSWNIESAENIYTVDVSLFVRLWVEIVIHVANQRFVPVSLFVRLWVEIIFAWYIYIFTGVSLFVRLWVEIYKSVGGVHCTSRQPLREAVSWNFLIWSGRGNTNLSASSWGCELKSISGRKKQTHTRSASSWGCELK